MSIVDKMFIKGIWVFDLENMCVIIFFRFFMFIVGLNGVGKMVWRFFEFERIIVGFFMYYGKMDFGLILCKF